MPCGDVAYALRELCDASEVVLFQRVAPESSGSATDDSFLSGSMAGRTRRRSLAQVTSGGGAAPETIRPDELAAEGERLQAEWLARRGENGGHDVAWAVIPATAGSEAMELYVAGPELCSTRIEALREAIDRIIARWQDGSDDRSETVPGPAELTVSERERRLDALGDLAGGIAHDFNNALTSVLGNVSLARLHGGLSRSVDGLLADAEEACLRARRLTRQLLTFAGGGEPVRRPLAVDGMLRELVSGAAADASCEVVLTMPSPPGPALVDEDQLRQAVSYLLDHAVAVTPDHGRIGVRLFADADTGAPTLTVQHSGPALSAEDRERLFDPFASVAPGGEGLGLSVAHSIIRRHGGRIEVLAEDGSPGAAFRVSLPAARVESPRSNGEDDSSDEGPVEGRRVLLMDDDAPVRVSLARLMRHLGHDVVEAEDGEEALRRWRSARDAGRPFDLAVMDLTVPHGMGGKEAIRRLLQVDPSARAVVASGYSKDPIMANYRAHGFVDVLEKPCELSTLRRVMSRVLQDVPHPV